MTPSLRKDKETSSFERLFGIEIWIFLILIEVELKPIWRQLSSLEGALCRILLTIGRDSTVRQTWNRLRFPAFPTWLLPPSCRWQKCTRTKHFGVTWILEMALISTFSTRQMINQVQVPLKDKSQGIALVFSERMVTDNIHLKICTHVDLFRRHKALRFVVHKKRVKKKKVVTWKAINYTMLAFVFLPLNAFSSPISAGGHPACTKSCSPGGRAGFLLGSYY